MSALTSPDYAGGSIVNLTATVLDAFGVDPPNPVCRHLHGDTLRGDGGIVLLICDALGLRQFETALRSGRTPNLRRLVELAPGGLQSLTSVFPSTTTVALTSLNTASTPQKQPAAKYAVSVFTGLLASGTSWPFSTKVSDAELRQWRSPVGGGPSLKTCPRCESHRTQLISVRFMP